jgi:addiction module HigA family antidote
MTNGGFVLNGKRETPTTSRLPIIIRRMAMSEEKLKPVHPGEVLLEEFLKPMALSQNHLALRIGVPARRINEIVLGKRGITADTALRLGRYFGMSPQFWLGLQMDYDLDVTADKLAERLEQEVRPYQRKAA